MSEVQVAPTSVGKKKLDAHQGVSKVERYKWKVRGEPGEFMLINKNELKIDHRYQRDEAQKRSLEFARDWSWVACGAISVAIREVDGRMDFWVVDGQHRVAAALLRTDIKELPCLCFEVDSVEEEAAGFYETNLHRGAVSTADRFRAMLIKKDPLALAVNDLVKTSDRTIAKYGAATTVSCIGHLMSIWENDSERVKKIFPLLLKICKGHPFHSSLVTGVFWLEGVMPEGESLTDEKHARRLVQIGPVRLNQHIAETSSYYGKRTARTSAIGILKAMNHGARNKIVIEIRDGDGNVMG